MTREIKFRAWDGEMMMPNDSAGMGSLVFLFMAENDGRLPSGIELMQYTGLKDKNGKEIYEGDIIRDNSGAVYIQGLCCAEKKIKEPKSTTTDFLWQEIIGNIYENSDLLK